MYHYRGRDIPFPQSLPNKAFALRFDGVTCTFAVNVNPKMEAQFELLVVLPFDEI